MDSAANTQPVRSSAFSKYAWFVLWYNVVVILWGVFLRASHSGDGCGQHWLTCHGEIVPSAPQLKTLIEFSHRITTAIAGLVVLVLVIWAFRAFRRGSIVLKVALASFLMIIVEALIGAGLVLTGNTAGANTPTRPFWTIGHLISTFILLAVLALTAWYANGRRPFSFAAPPKVKIALLIGFAGILLSGISGSIAALSNMLFPSASLAEGFAANFSAASPLIVNLRISHPIVSIAIAVYLYLLTLWVIKSYSEIAVLKRLANMLTGLLVLQVAAGSLTYFTHAPIVMQLVHLLLADLLWIVFVLMSVEWMAESANDAQSLKS